MTAASVVTVREVSKRFGSVPALTDVTLTLRAGQVTGLVGPNAAGKSTLIKCLLGLVRPDHGGIAVHGCDPAVEWDVRRHIGYMPQAPRFPDNLSGQEIVRMLDDLRGNPAEVDEELDGRFHLEPELDKPVRTLSGGTRQKLSAAIAFRYRPTLLILDEPTSGLDPVSSGVLKEKVAAAAGAGAAVLWASHVMAELEPCIDTLIYLAEGRSHFEGPLAELWHATGETRLEPAVQRLMRARIVA